MKFKESELAHKYLDGLSGLEIGGSAHNPFGLRTLNVDYTDDMETIYKKGEYDFCQEKMPVDIVADGDNIPVEDESQDFVISSHVMEHFFDPIKALKEWMRVTKVGGYIFIIAPTHYSLPGETRPCTQLEELIRRHEGKLKPSDIDMGINAYPPTGEKMGDEHGHFSVWDLVDFLEICKYLKYTVVEALEADDKVGNGFCVILQK